MDLLKYYASIADHYPKYVNQKQVSEILGIHKKTAANIEKIGEIPYEIIDNRVGKYKRLHRSHRIKLVDVLAYMFFCECQKNIAIQDVVEYVSDFDELVFYLPRFLSKEQFYKVCHISKKTALKLIDKNLVTGVKTGEKTSKYKIPREEVIRYLKERDITPERYRFPATLDNHRKIEPYPDHIAQQVFDYYYDLFSEYPDLLTTKEASNMLCFSADTIKKWISEKRFRVFSRCNAYLIPKISLTRWIADPVFAVPRIPTLISLPMYSVLVDYHFNRSNRTMLAKEGVLVYCPPEKQYDIRFGLHDYHGGLEAGVRLDVFVRNKWITTRLIKAKEWELEEIDTHDLTGLRVKIY